MSLLLEALKKAEKAKQKAKQEANSPSPQVGKPVAPREEVLALDFGAPLPPPVVEATAQPHADESAFPEITLDELPPLELHADYQEVVQPEPVVHEPMFAAPDSATLELLITPNFATLDLPEIELAGMQDNPQTEAKPEARTEPVLSLDFEEPAQSPAALEIEPPQPFANAEPAGMGDFPPMLQMSQAGQSDLSPILQMSQTGQGDLPPISQTGQAGQGDLPPISQMGQAGQGNLSPSLQNSEPARMDSMADALGQQSAAHIAPPSVVEQSAPPPPPSPKPAADKATNREIVKKFFAAKQGAPKRNLKLLGGIFIGSMVVGAAAAYYYWQMLSQPATQFHLPPQQAAMPPAPQPPVEPQPVVPPVEPQPVVPPVEPQHVVPPVEPQHVAPPVEPQPVAPPVKPQPVVPPVKSQPVAQPKESQPVTISPLLPPPAISETPVAPGKPAGKPPTQAKPVEALPAETPPKGATSAGAGKGAGKGAEENSVTPVDEMEEAPVGASAKSPDSGIKIRRDTVDAQLDPLLTSAYQAFMAGDIGKAETDYRKALRRTPNSRDALLGLAAIATNRNQVHEAISLYQRVLQLDPGDAAAQAGLIGLRGFADTTMSESRLKILLAQNPNVGYLHFALGNQYAQQLRWSEAQEAYFNALHADSGNADYAFNLAVSLEHLGQRKPALTYYRRALDLAKKRSAGFNGELLENRIYELQRQD